MVPKRLIIIPISIIGELSFPSFPIALNDKPKAIPRTATHCLIFKTLFKKYFEKMALKTITPA